MAQEGKPVRSMKRRLALAAVALGVTYEYVLAAELPSTGAFLGHGRQCYGTLFIRTRTLEWHTPFANCDKTRYTVIRKTSGADSAMTAYLLRGNPKCAFGVITLDWNIDYPDKWNATGYRSLADYEQRSQDRLRCNLEKMNE